MEVAFSTAIACCRRSIQRPLLTAQSLVGVTRASLPVAPYSSPSNAGDRGPDNNYKKKLKKERRKRTATGLNTNVLIDVLKQFEQEASVEARVQSDKEDRELGDLLAAMKVPPQQSPSPSVPQLKTEKRGQGYKSNNKGKLFASSTRLGVFEKPAQGVSVLPEPVVDLEEEEKSEQVRMMLKLKPTNVFESMLQESKEMWSYPIDNEVCKTSEENVGFEEHVLLDHLLEGFPSRGPVRHFMELVVNGLSKNPYYTVEEKHQFIDEYRRFFNKYSLEELQAETHTTRTEHHASVTS